MWLMMRWRTAPATEGVAQLTGVGVWSPRNQHHQQQQHARQATSPPPAADGGGVLQLVQPPFLTDGSPLPVVVLKSIAILIGPSITSNEKQTTDLECGAELPDIPPNNLMT
jgi:hypothetical protein